MTQPFRPRRDRETVDELLETIQPPDQGGRDAPRIDEIITALGKLRDNPNISPNGAKQVQAEIDALLSGDSDIAFTDPSGLIEGRGIFSDLEPLGKGLDFLGSAVRSGLNQVQRLPTSFDIPSPVPGLAFGQARGREAGPADRVGLSGFLSGLSTGDDPVSGLDLIDNAGLPSDFGPDLRIPTGPLGRLPVIPDAIPLPDFDTIAGLAVEIGTDPLTFLRAPAILARGADGLYATRATAAASRQGRFAANTIIARRGRALGVADDVLNRAISSVAEGGLVGLIREARRGVDGLTPKLLDDLGVQRGITFAGRVLPGGEAAASVLGAIRVHSLTGKVPKALEGIGDAITQSAMQGYYRNLLSNGASPLEAIDLANFAKANALKSRQHINLSRDAMRPYFEKLGKGIPEEDLRSKFVESSLDEVASLAEKKTVWQRAMDGLVRFMEERGLRVKDLEITDETLGSSPLEQYMRQPGIAREDAILAPAVAYGLVQLDSAARRFIGESPMGSRLASELIGDAGVMNRNAATLRQFMQNVSAIEVFGAASRLDTIGSTLDNTFFDLAHSVPDEILDHFGLLESQVSRGLSEVDELTGASAVLREARRSGGGIPLEFEQTITRTITAAFDSLASGDVAVVRESLNRLSEIGTMHTEALDNLVNAITRGGGAAIENADRAYGRANVARAAAMSDEELLSETHRILKNEWFNPDLVRPGGQGSLFQAKLISSVDRPVILEAFRRNPEYVNGVLDELRGWIDEWTVTAQETFRQYDAAFTPEIAQQLKEIDTFYHAALRAAKVFGQGAMDAVNGLRSAAVTGQTVDTGFGAISRGMADEDLAALASQIRNIHGKADRIGVSPGRWSKEMHEHLEFLTSLRREPLPPGMAGQVANAIIQANRAIFRPLALFGPGFIMRNFMGQIRLNFLQGVRATGRGGYREFSPIYDIVRAALRDEAINFAAPRSSAAWSRIAPEMLDEAQELAYSGVLVSPGVGGALERAFELQQGSVGRRLGQFSDFIDRQQTRIEQVVTPALQASTSGRVPSLGSIANNPAGLQAGTRREIESYMRGALAWSNMRKGGTLEDGLNAISRTHFDYWDLTARGQLIDELMPFWVFRSRITTLAASMAVSSPGLAATVFRLREMTRDRDPYGAGQTGTWTIGAGNYRGLSWEINPRDPLNEGFNTILSPLEAFSNSDNLVDTLTTFTQDQLTDRLAPAIGLPINSAFGTTTSFGETRGDRFGAARGQDGLSARIAEWAIDSPIGPMLEATGALRTVDGEPVLTNNGREYLTNAIPILGTLERIMTEELQGEGEPFTQEEVDRRTLNAWFNFTGVPYQLFSEGQRNAVAQSIVWDLEDYEDLLAKVEAFRSDNESNDLDAVLAEMKGN